MEILTEPKQTGGGRRGLALALALGLALRLDADVPGATVFLDRKYLGTTPVETGAFEPGHHRGAALRGRQARLLVFQKAVEAARARL